MGGFSLETENKIALEVILFGVEEAVSRIKYLGKAIKKESKALSYNVSGSFSILENVLENTTKHASDLSSEFKDLQNSLNASDLSSAFDSIESDVESTGNSVGKFSKDFESDFKDLQNSLNASDLSSAFDSIESDVESTGNSVGKFSKDFESDFKDLKESMNNEPFTIPDNVFEGVRKGAMAFSKEIYDAQGKTIGLQRAIEETTGLGMRNIVNTVQRWDSSNKKWVTTNKKMTIGSKSFRMEALGVMFAGMGVTRMFGGLTQGGIEWLGIGPMLTDAFSLMTYSAIEPFSDSLYGASSAFLNLDEAQKKSMGEFLIAGQIGGMALQTFGGLILALSSMSQLFGDSPIFMGAATTALGLMLGKVSEFVSVIPGMEGIGAALKVAAGGVAGAGVVKTISAVVDIKDITGTGITLGAIAQKLPGVFKLVGAALVVDALINILSDPTVDTGLKNKVQFAIGAAIMGKGYGLAGKTAISMAIGMTLLIDAIPEFLKTDKTFTDSLWASFKTYVGLGLLGFPGPWQLRLVLSLGLVIDWFLESNYWKDMLTYLTKKFYEVYNALGRNLDKIGIGWDEILPEVTGGGISASDRYIREGASGGVFGGTVGDFVMTNGKVYKTHPDDTIVGTKGGMSGETYITVNVTNSGGNFNERYFAEKVGEAVRSELSGRAR